MKLPALFAAAAAIHLSSSAWADVAVDDVTARQRYPWNGLVDITCSVSGIDGETNGLKLAIAAVMPDTGRARNVKHFQIVRDGADPDDREIRTNGTYRLLWDAAADLGPVRFTNMVVRVKFNVHDKVQLWEGGPYWATTNIGAEEPWESGLYFWWGDTVGYWYDGSAWVASDGSSSGFRFDNNIPTYGKSTGELKNEGWITADDVLAPEHDAAQVQWGDGWRMPTYQELDDLCHSKCDWIWTSTNGVNGYVVRGKGDYAIVSIFLPASGDASAASIYNGGALGIYWSSVSSSSSSSYLRINPSNHYMSSYSRDYGHFIRPVQGFAE